MNIMAIMVWYGMGIYITVYHKETKKQLKKIRKDKGEIVFIYYIIMLLAFAPVWITIAILEKINEMK